MGKDFLCGIALVPAPILFRNTQIYSIARRWAKWKEFRLTLSQPGGGGHIVPPPPPPGTLPQISQERLELRT